MKLNLQKIADKLSETEPINEFHEDLIDGATYNVQRLNTFTNVTMPAMANAAVEAAEEAADSDNGHKVRETAEVAAHLVGGFASGTKDVASLRGRQIGRFGKKVPSAFKGAWADAKAAADSMGDA